MLSLFCGFKGESKYSLIAFAKLTLFKQKVINITSIEESAFVESNSNPNSVILLTNASNA